MPTSGLKLGYPARWKMRTTCCASRTLDRRRLSYLPFIAHAYVDASLAHPALNAHYGPSADQSTRFDWVDLAVAVDLDLGGLVTRVMLCADELRLETVAGALEAVVDRARSGVLAQSDLSVGTSTLTNIGSLGATSSIPVIHHPHMAIHAMDAVVPQVRPIRAAFAIRTIGHVGLVFDHRVADCVYAATMLKLLRRLLEEGDPATW